MWLGGWQEGWLWGEFSDAGGGSGSRSGGPGPAHPLKRLFFHVEVWEELQPLLFISVISAAAWGGGRLAALLCSSPSVARCDLQPIPPPQTFLNSSVKTFKTLQNEKHFTVKPTCPRPRAASHQHVATGLVTPLPVLISRPSAPLAARTLQASVYFPQNAYCSLELSMF